jgi:hypothetical protein
MPHPPYSPEIIPYNFWFFLMLKQILRNREFSSSDEIEETIAWVWNDITFADVQSVFRDWIRRLAWVAESDGEYTSEWNKIRFLMSAACWNWDGGRGLSGHPVCLANRVGAVVMKHDASRIWCHFRSLVAYWIVRMYQNVAWGIRRWKFTFFLFKSGKM